MITTSSSSVRALAVTGRPYTPPSVASKPRSLKATWMGGTCVNRGCVPSKALLAASGRVRDMKNADHLKHLGIAVDNVSFDRQGIADHAKIWCKLSAGI